METSSNLYLEKFEHCVISCSHAFIQTIKEQPPKKKIVNRKKLGKKEIYIYLYPSPQSKQWKEPCGV
jgi:hypothetical protein